VKDEDIASLNSLKIPLNLIYMGTSEQSKSYTLAIYIIFKRFHFLFF